MCDWRMSVINTAHYYFFRLSEVVTRWMTNTICVFESCHFPHLYYTHHIFFLFIHETITLPISSAFISYKVTHSHSLTNHTSITVRRSQLQPLLCRSTKTSPTHSHIVVTHHLCVWLRVPGRAKVVVTTRYRCVGGALTMEVFPRTKGMS